MAESGLSSGVGLAVLCAALMHAGWNALIRGTPDKPLFTVLLHLCSALLAAVGLCFTGWPNAASTPYIIASALLHSLYIVLLMRADDGGQLAVGYVLMRGLASLIFGLVAVLVLHELLSPTGWAGIACILTGVLVIALASGQTPRDLLRHRSGRAAWPQWAVFASVVHTSTTVCLFLVNRMFGNPDRTGPGAPGLVA